MCESKREIVKRDTRQVHMSLNFVRTTTRFFLYVANERAQFNKMKGKYKCMKSRKKHRRNEIKQILTINRIFVQLIN